MNLETATEQEVFDHVAAHLLRQGRKSMEAATTVCRYKLGALMCAAGCLLEPGQYHPSMEGVLWSNLAHLGKVPLTHVELVCELQEIHDDSEPLDWAAQLRKLAARKGLTANF